MHGMFRIEDAWEFVKPQLAEVKERTFEYFVRSLENDWRFKKGPLPDQYYHDRLDPKTGKLVEPGTEDEDNENAEAPAGLFR
jgi:hypothetical protein